MSRSSDKHIFISHSSKNEMPATGYVERSWPAENHFRLEAGRPRFRRTKQF